MEDVFIAPIARRRFKSPRGKTDWLEGEGWEDSVAGLLLSDVESGGCEHVSTRADKYFPSVNDPALLAEPPTGVAYQAGLKGRTIGPVSDSEHEDLHFMKSLLGTRREVIEDAIRVEGQRWQTNPRRDLGGNSLRV